MNRKKRTLPLSFLMILLMIGGGFSCTEYRAKNHYEKGLTAIEEGKYSEAVIEFKNAVALDPNNTDALYQLGLAYLKLGGSYGLQNGYKTFSNLALKSPDNITVQLKLGEILLIRNDIEAAETRADFVLAKQPKNAEAHLLRARIGGRKRQLDTAKKAYKQVIDLDKNILPAYHELAAILIVEKKIQEAEDLLHLAILQSPKVQNSYFVLAHFYQMMGKTKDEEAQYKKAIEIAPKNKAGYFLLARYYLRQKNGAEAENALKTASGIDKKDDEPFLILGDFYLGQNKTDSAEKAYLAAKSALPKSGKWGKRLAALYLSQSKNKQAAAEIDSLLQRNESDNDAMFLKGHLLLLDKKHLLAIDQFNKVLIVNPAYPQAHYYLGLAYANTADSVQAKTAFLNAVKDAPNDVRAHLALATLYMQERSYDLVIPEAQQVLKWDPRNVAAATLLADVALIQKQVSQAEELSQKILMLSPKNQQALFRMGSIRRVQKKEGDAISFFEKVLSENINGIEALSQIVAIHLQNKKPEKAIDRVSQQITASPKNPRFYALQGRLYSGIGKLGKAEESFKKGNLVDTRFLDIYLDLALLYSAEKKGDQGIAELEKAIKIDPKFVQAYMLKGTINDSRGNLAEARTAYEKVMALSPKHASAANNLAWIYAEHGDKIDRALELATIAKENHPENPMISDTLGWVYYKKGLYLKAVSLLEESAEKIQKNPIVHYHLGMAYSKRGDPGDKKRARQSLQQALKIDPRFSGSDIAKKTLASL